MSILVVDDDPALARLIRVVLEQDGYVVAEAHSLKEADAARGPFGLVLADVRLPNGDGRHLQGLFPNVPFITMSGHDDEMPDLPKPFSPTQLLDAIHLRLGVVP